MTTLEKIEYWVAGGDMTPIEMALLEMILNLQLRVKELEESK